MRLLRPLILAAAAALPCFAQAAPTLTVCIDNAAGGFNYGTATCVVDNGWGDAAWFIPGVLTTYNLLGTSFPQFTTTTAYGEPTFGPGFGMSLSTDGAVSGSWIIAIAQTGLVFGNAVPTPTMVGANFTGSTSGGPGTASYALYVDDLNRGLDAWGPVGTPVASGGFGSGGNNVTLTDPFSMLAFVTLDATRGATYYSTDLTVTVPEPTSLALAGVALLGLGAGARRRKTKREAPAA